MQYNMQQGVQHTWIENAKSLTAGISGREWLPVAITSITGLWLCLLMVSVLQGSPTIPGTTSHLPKRQSGNNLTVSYRQTGVTVGNSSQQSTSTVASTSPMRVATASTRSNAGTTTAGSIVQGSDTSDIPIIGGKGGDGVTSDPVGTVTAPVTDPVTTVTDPITQPIIDPIVNELPPVQVQVNTPVGNVGVDTSDGLNVHTPLLNL